MTKHTKSRERVRGLLDSIDILLGSAQEVAADRDLDYRVVLDDLRAGYNQGRARIAEIDGGAVIVETPGEG